MEFSLFKPIETREEFKTSIFRMYGSAFIVGAGMLGFVVTTLATGSLLSFALFSISIAGIALGFKEAYRLDKYAITLRNNDKELKELNVFQIIKMENEKC